MYIPSYGHLDFNRPTNEVVLDLIYLTNKVKLHSTHATIDEKSIIAIDTRPDIDWDENSMVKVNVKGNDYPPTNTKKSFFYHRLTFDAAGLQKLPTSYGGKSVWDILPDINAAYHTNITTADVVNAVIPANGIFKLQATKTSPIWQGNSNATTANALLSVTDLNTFNKYAA
jgi:hypothetical protein